MEISYELYGRSFFHTDCVEGQGNGIMKPVEHEKDKTLLKCNHCGKRGYYPVGSIGKIIVVSEDEI